VRRILNYCSPAASYSFSFAPYYTSALLYPGGEEFQEYLQQVTDKYQLGPHIQLNTDVAELRWVEADAEWEVTLHHLIPGTGELSALDRQERVAKSGPESVYVKKEKIRAKIVVSCLGVVVQPNPWPSDVKGRETYQGEVFHTSR
jgi:cation diffusion facilitator CzcD-associated flavoprotein CzcO